MKIIPEHRLKTEDVLQMTLKVMQAHLTLQTEGYCSSTEKTRLVLLKTVAERSSIEATCADSVRKIASNTLREQLNGALPVTGLREQEAEMNAALQAAIPFGMPRGGMEAAIDLHDEPCYGKSEELRAC